MRTAVLSALVAAVCASARPTGTYDYDTRQMSNDTMSSPMNNTMSGGMGGGMMGNMTVPTDTQILQYALTLEHLEATFYSQALQKYSAQDFENAGFPDWVRARVNEVMMHEMSHVTLLTNALGKDAVAACDYSFPYTDVQSFLVLACGLENIGTSAYLGALQYISNKEYLTIAGTITSVEARHQSFFYAPVLKQSPWTGPYDTPIGLDMVYTLASQLITSCPSSNPMLPVMAFPALTIMGSPIANAKAGDTINVTFNSTMEGTMYAAVYNGLGSAVVSMDGMSFTLPEGIQGYSFVLITTASNISDVSTSNIVAGPAELQTSFDSMQSNPGFMNPLGS